MTHPQRPRQATVPHAPRGSAPSGDPRLRSPSGPLSAPVLEKTLAPSAARFATPDGSATPPPILLRRGSSRSAFLCAAETWSTNARGSSLRLLETQHLRD